MANLRKNMAVQIQTPGGDNPLLLKLVQKLPLYTGIAVTGLSLVGQGGKPPYSYEIIETSNSDLPPGLTIADPLDGTISGTPTTAGHYTFIAVVSDANAQSFPHSFSLDVRAPIVWVRYSPTPGENLLTYRYRMVASDLSGTYITSGYSLDSGNLPDGLTLLDDGTIIGDPTFGSIGISYATIKVTTGAGSATIPIVITIFSPLLGFSPENPTRPYASLPFTSGPTVVATGGFPPYHYQWDNLADYPWLTFDYNANRFSGTPPISNIGIEQTITGRVTDSLGAVIDPVTFKFTPVYAQQGVTTGGGDVAWTPGTGLLVLESDDDSVDITTTSNGHINLRAVGGGGGGDLSTINHVGPDSSGNIDIVSPDGSVTIGEDSSGRLTLEAVAGGGIYILGVPSNGTQYVAYAFSPTPVGFTPDKWDAPSALGALQTGLTVDPATGDISGTPTVHGTSTAYAVALESTTGKTAWIRYDLTIDAPSGTDPYFANVVLLMHMDGINGSTTFIDVIGHTLTPVGSAQISTADYVFGGASGLFSTATSDWVDVAASSDFSFGTGDFTIEGWFQVPDTGLHFILGWDSDNGIYAASSQLLFWNGGSNIVGTSGTLLTNTWYYFALTRESGVVTMWLDGTFVQSNPFTTNYANTNFRVGGRTTGSNGMTGYLDDIRVTKGVARYSSNFTRPATPFPDS